MSKFTDQIEEHIDSARGAIDRADPNDPRLFADLIMDATRNLHEARKLSDKLKPGFILRGTKALIAEHEEEAHALFVKALSSD